MPSTVPSASPYQTDATTRVSIWVDGFEQLYVEDYSIDQDILSIGDPFRIRIPNIDGMHSSRLLPSGDGGVRFLPGALCKIFMSSQKVENTGDVQKLLGRVTSVDYQCDRQSGSTITIAGADIGWHLRECHAPFWTQVPGGISFSNLVDRVIPPATFAAWGFQGIRYNNLENTKICQGRAGVERRIARDEAAGRTKIFPMQIEPGQCAADILIEFARRAHNLVNVSQDGYLQFYQPNDSVAGPRQPGDPGTDYKIRLYKSTSASRNQGNVQTAKVTRSLDGVYTKTTCIGTVTQSTRLVTGQVDTPNRTRFAESYTPPTPPLDWPRPFYFSDGDQLTHAMAKSRAEWKWKRGKFDSLVAEYTVSGHTQNGLFWMPDTCVDVLDEINGLNGIYYISAVNYSRSQQGGTTTKLTIHEAGVLAA